MTDLKLVALDAEDLAVLSACVQDAVLHVGDVDWRPRERRLVLAMNRFAWEAEAGAAPGGGPHQRRRACLRFDRVSGVRSHGIDRTRRDSVLVLLAVVFRPSDGPSGTVELVFAGDAAIRLEVECLEVELADLGAAWAAGRVPAHGA